MIEGIIMAVRAAGERQMRCVGEKICDEPGRVTAQHSTSQKPTTKDLNQGLERSTREGLDSLFLCDKVRPVINKWVRKPFSFRWAPVGGHRLGCP